MEEKKKKKIVIIAQGNRTSMFDSMEKQLPKLDFIEKTRKRADNLFSIVIPTWNNIDFLKNCIESIRNHSVYSHQIIIAVNGSTDGTVEWLTEQDDIDYVDLKENLGVCYAMNIVRTLIKTEYLFYLNDDMYLLPNWDKHLYEEVKIAENFSKWFMLSMTTIDPRPNNHSAFIEADYGTTLASFEKDRLIKEFEGLPGKDWSGSSWPPNIVPVQLWDVVGGYSPEYSPGYGSDPDFVHKLWSFGVRYFKGVDRSRCYHFGSVSTKKIKVDNSKVIFVRKYGYSINKFMTKYLKWGQKWNGPLEDTAFSSFERLRNKLKLLITASK